MQVVTKMLSDLTPYESNPRLNDGAVDAVAASIREFGFKVPLIVDSDGVIVAGHTRYKAAQKLDYTSVPCIVADDLTPEQIKAFRLADNQTASLSQWDFPALDAELASLQGIFDMTNFGFDLRVEVEPLDLGDIAGHVRAKDADKLMCACPKCGFKFAP